MNSYTNYFSYSGDVLTCEGVSLEEIAREFGTPLYVYTERGFRERYMEMDRSLEGLDRLICYSVKANSNVNILRLMKEMGSGMDVVSGGEIFRALHAGVEPRKIVYAGVGKSADEIGYALEKSILMFNCESIPEVGVIDAEAGRRGMQADIAIRVNPDVDAQTHHYITTGKKENKFGISIDGLAETAARIKECPHVRLRGIHCHIGSQIVTMDPFITALERVIDIIADLKKSGFGDINCINLGGGFGIRYRDEEFFPIADWAKEVKKRVSGLGLRLIIEPGRYLSGNNGTLLVRVLYRKTGPSKTFLITDGAMNDLIRPSLYDAYQEILNCRRGDGNEKVDVVGPICESGDFFAKDRVITRTGEGDLLAVMSTGAYGMAMASRYNSRRLPAEVMVMSGGTVRLIRRRDTYEDMIANEIV